MSGVQRCAMTQIWELNCLISLGDTIQCSSVTVIYIHMKYSQPVYLISGPMWSKRRSFQINVPIFKLLTKLI